MKKGPLFFITLLAAFTVTANAASFDCTKAASRIDNAICASPEISKLDSELDGVYKAALAKSSDADAIKTAQRAWLKDTRNQCLDETCFVTAYQQRIAALRSVAPQQITETKANADVDETTAKKLAEENTAKEAEKVEEQKATELAAPATQAKKTEDQATVDAQAKKQADESGAAKAKKETNDTELVKGVLGLFLIIAAIIYAIVQRNRRKNSTESAFDKSFDLNKSIPTIISEAFSNLKTDARKDTADEMTNKNMHFESKSANEASNTALQNNDRSLLVRLTGNRLLVGIGLVIFDVFFVAFLTGSFNPTPRITVGDDYVCEYARLPANGAYDCGADKEHPFWPEPFATKETLGDKTLEEYNDEKREVWKRLADVERYYEHRHDAPNAPKPNTKKSDTVELVYGLTIVSITVAVLFGVGALVGQLPVLGRWIAHGDDSLLLRILAIPLWLTGVVIYLICIVIFLVIAYKIAIRMAQRLGILPYSWEK
jgi:uncharacterized protein